MKQTFHLGVAALLVVFTTPSLFALGVGGSTQSTVQTTTSVDGDMLHSSSSVDADANVHVNSYDNDSNDDDDREDDEGMQTNKTYFSHQGKVNAMATTNAHGRFSVFFKDKIDARFEKMEGKYSDEWFEKKIPNAIARIEAKVENEHYPEKFMDTLLYIQSKLELLREKMQDDNEEDAQVAARLAADIDTDFSFASSQSVDSGEVTVIQQPLTFEVANEAMVDGKLTLKSNTLYLGNYIDAIALYDANGTFVAQGNIHYGKVTFDLATYALSAGTHTMYVAFVAEDEIETTIHDDATIMLRVDSFSGMGAYSDEEVEADFSSKINTTLTFATSA